MAHIGHPLLGDPLYGSGTDTGLCRAALHAGEIIFEQPFSGKVICLQAALPEDMRAYLDGTEGVFYETGTAEISGSRETDAAEIPESGSGMTARHE